MLKVVQLIDDTKIDESKTKRIFVEIYHQHGAQVVELNQKNNFFFRENLNYIQFGSSYLELEMEVEKLDCKNFTETDEIKLNNIASAYVFQDARISNGTEIEQSKHDGPVSTVMSLIKHKHTDLSTYFKKFDETGTGIVNTSLKYLVVNNHIVYATKGNMKGHLPLEHIFDFCKNFKKNNKTSGFKLRLQTSTSEKSGIFTTMGGNHISGTIKSSSLYIPIFIPRLQIPLKLNEANNKSFTLLSISWTSNGEPVNMEEYQLHEDSASNLNLSVCLIAVH